MKQKYFAVMNSENPKVGEIKIYGIIGAWWEEANTANAFVRAFNNLERTCDRINIHVNSPGGSVHEGLPIINAIKASKVDVHTYVDGIAYSMGAMITIAAKKGNVHMAKGSLLMLHSVSTGIYGNAQALRDEADVLDKYDDVLGALIESRTGKSLEDIKSNYLNHNDNYFTPAEALTDGLIDAVEDYDATDMPENVQNMSYGQIAAWYASNEEPSEGMMSKIMSRLKTAFSNDKSNTEEMFGNKFSKLAAMAKVAVASITDEQLNEVNAQIAESGVEGLTVVKDSELESVSNELEGLKTAQATLETDKKNLETKVSEKDARITELENEVAALKGKPATPPANVITDKDDNPDAGDKKEVDDFATSVDAEYDAIYGSSK